MMERSAALPLDHPDHHRAGRDHPGDPDLPARVRFLASAAEDAVVIETHLSYVVLCGDRAMKLKKPVRTPFQDLRTHAARRRNALEELRLNRRLAQEIYLDVLAMRWHGDRLDLVPSDRPDAAEGAIDWVVLMRRLPLPRMLDRRIIEGTVQLGELDALGDRLGRFYRDAPRAGVGPGAYLNRLRRELRGHANVLRRPAFADLRGGELTESLARALAMASPALAARAASGALVEGHGDLRPEHVCLLSPPVVIDCLEFDPALRRVDPLEELALLDVECEHLGDARAGGRVRDRCLEVLGDGAPGALWHLHRARQAVSRARFTVAHLLEREPRTPAVWRPRTASYLRLAQAALARLQRAPAGAD